MSPLAQTEGHDAPRLIDELVLGVAAVVDDIVVGSEDPVRQPVVAHELPDVLDRVQLGASGRQRHQGDVGRDDQFGRAMPSSLIKQEDGVCSRRDVEGDLLKVHAHRLAVALGHDDAGGLAFSGTDRSKDPCRGPTLIPWYRRTSAALRPTPGELGLLADPCLVLPPDLDRRTAWQASRYRCQLACEVFLIAEMASAF